MVRCPPFMEFLVHIFSACIAATSMDIRHEKTVNRHFMRERSHHERSKYVELYLYNHEVERLMHHLSRARKYAVGWRAAFAHDQYSLQSVRTELQSIDYRKKVIHHVQLSFHEAFIKMQNSRQFDSKQLGLQLHYMGLVYRDWLADVTMPFHRVYGRALDWVPDFLGYSKIQIKKAREGLDPTQKIDWSSKSRRGFEINRI